MKIMAEFKASARAIEVALALGRNDANIRGVTFVHEFNSAQTVYFDACDPQVVKFVLGYHERLRRYSAYLEQHGDMSLFALTKTYLEFTFHSGQTDKAQVDIGRVLATGKGECLEKAIGAQVLFSSVGIDSNVTIGIYAHMIQKGSGHAWTEISVGRRRIFDPAEDLGRCVIDAKRAYDFNSMVAQRGLGYIPAQQGLKFAQALRK